MEKWAGAGSECDGQGRSLEVGWHCRGLWAGKWLPALVLLGGYAKPCDGLPLILQRGNSLGVWEQVSLPSVSQAPLETASRRKKLLTPGISRDTAHHLLHPTPPLRPAYLLGPTLLLKPIESALKSRVHFLDGVLFTCLCVLAGICHMIKREGEPCNSALLKPV